MVVDDILRDLLRERIDLLCRLLRVDGEAFFFECLLLRRRLFIFAPPQTAATANSSCERIDMLEAHHAWLGLGLG